MKEQVEPLEEAKQMNADTVCAASDGEMNWHEINWVKCHSQVRRLQARIVKVRRDVV